MVPTSKFILKFDRYLQNIILISKFNNDGYLNGFGNEQYKFGNDRRDYFGFGPGLDIFLLDPDQVHRPKPVKTRPIYSPSQDHI